MEWVLTIWLITNPPGVEVAQRIQSFNSLNECLGFFTTVAKPEVDKLVGQVIQSTPSYEITSYKYSCEPEVGEN